TLLGGAAEPARGFREILRDAAAVRIGEAEIELGRRVSLLGGAVIPEDRAHGVARNAETVLVERAQIVLRVGKALLRRDAELLGGTLVILRHAVAEGVT